MRALRARGIASGDAIALMVANRAELAEVVAASLRCGLRYTPINWHLTADEAAYIVDDCEARVLVADAASPPSPSRSPHGAGLRVRLAVGGDIDGFERYADAIAPEPGADIADPCSAGRCSTRRARPAAEGRAPRAADARCRLAVRLRARRVACTCAPARSTTRRRSFSLAESANAGTGVVLMDGWTAATPCA